MARKRTPPKQHQADAPAPDTASPLGAATGPALRTDAKSRFVLYNLLGQPRVYYRVDRADLARPAEPCSDKGIAHSVILIDRSGSMTPWIEELKGTLIKLLTLEEYTNIDLLVTLISYSGEGDARIHFQRSPIQKIMQKDSKQQKEIGNIHATGATCVSQALQLAESLVEDDEMTAVTLHSDGYANDPSANGESRSIEEMCGRWQQRMVFLNTLAYSDYADFRLLSKIANSVSGVCLKVGSIREIYEALYATARLLGGSIAPPIEEPLSPEYDYQVFVSHSAGKVNGAAGPLHIRGLKPDDDAAVYKFRTLTKAEFGKLKDVPVAQTSEAVLAFARAHLAEGNLNTAKYGLASSFDRTLIERHGRALTNVEVANFARDLDTILFQPGLLGEHEIADEVPVNRKIALLSLVRLLAEHKDDFTIDLRHLRQNYIRKGLRRIRGWRDPDGKLFEPWVKAEFADKGDRVKVQSFDINRNTANLNVLIARPVRLVQAGDGKQIDEVAGIKLDTLSSYNNYTLVSDGELNVRTLMIRIAKQELFDRLSAEGVLEQAGRPATRFSTDIDYTLCLDALPLVPPLEGKPDLAGVFDRLAGLKVLASVAAAHLKEVSDEYTDEQVEELKRHYLSKNLYVNFPTTTEYADLQQALGEGTVDARVSYKIDLGSRTILNLSKLHSANKFLERIYEVTDASGQKIDKPKFEDCLEGVTYKHKTLSARTKVTAVDEFMKRLFDDFLGVAPNGSAVALLKEAGAKDLAKFVAGRAKGRQPARAAFVAALAQVRKVLESRAEELFAQKVSPLVFYVGSTGVLPDEIDARAWTADEIARRHPGLALSKDEQDGLFFEVDDALVAVYAKREYFSRDRTLTGGENVAPGQED